jgi:hypothetical protein
MKWQCVLESIQHELRVEHDSPSDVRRCAPSGSRTRNGTTFERSPVCSWSWAANSCGTSGVTALINQDGLSADGLSSNVSARPLSRWIVTTTSSPAVVREVVNRSRSPSGVSTISTTPSASWPLTPTGARRVVVGSFGVATLGWRIGDPHPDTNGR